jgi:selenocysteine lyase/cysteine desulfurase
VITPIEPTSHANIVSIAWQGDHEAVVKSLEEQGIIIRTHLDNTEKPYLRISTHCYNTEDEVIRVGEALEGLQ